jgi:energy-coupling factor transporter ATP-binding protein EcfA2
MKESWYDFRLKNGSSMLVCGPTQSGKSTFVNGLLEHLDIFETKPKNIYWFFGQFNNELSTKPYITNEGLPEHFQNVEPFSIVVLDDLMEEAKNHVGVTNLFTKLVHHKKLFVINISQNFYQQSKDARTRRLNSQYIVLFKNPADVTQVNTLARQMFPSCPKFLSNVYNSVTRRPHGYLFIDLRQETPDEIRIRTNVLPHEFPMQVFNNKTFCI